VNNLLVHSVTEGFDNSRTNRWNLRTNTPDEDDEISNISFTGNDKDMSENPNGYIVSSSSSSGIRVPPNSVLYANNEGTRVLGSDMLRYNNNILEYGTSIQDIIPDDATAAITVAIDTPGDVVPLLAQNNSTTGKTFILIANDIDNTIEPPYPHSVFSMSINGSGVTEEKFYDGRSNGVINNDNGNVVINSEGTTADSSNIILSYNNGDHAHLINTHGSLMLQCSPTNAGGTNPYSGKDPAIGSVLSYQGISNPIDWIDSSTAFTLLPANNLFVEVNPSNSSVKCILNSVTPGDTEVSTLEAYRNCYVSFIPVNVVAGSISSVLLTRNTNIIGFFVQNNTYSVVYNDDQIFTSTFNVGDTFMFEIKTSN
jgi:hypothetical protein